MVNVMVFYDPVKKESYGKNSVHKNRIPSARIVHFISPRILVSGDGAPCLILDNKIEGSTVVEVPQAPGFSVDTRNRKEILDPLNDKPLLKSHCCEKYLKGKRCKRCPCFDLQ